MNCKKSSDRLIGAASSNGVTAALFSVAMATSLSLVTTLVSTLVWSTPACAQFANTQGKTVIIPAGTTFEGRMDSTISSNHSHAGDRFNVVMSAPVLANGSDVVIPAGSQIVGEVVEALSSGSQPHAKGQKLNGKLRVQLTALRTPDGVTYPLIGSFIAETSGKGPNARINPNLGSGVAYVGNQQNFNAVYPNARGNGNRGPQLVTKRQMMEDPLYGDPDKKDTANQAPNIRSITKNKREMYIHEGAPMSVRLDAPLKMAITPVGGMAPSSFSESAQPTQQAPSRPTFTRPRSAIAAPPSPQADAQQQAPQAAPPTAATAPPVTPQGSGFPSFLDPLPGQRPPQAVPQFQPPPAAAPAAQSFGQPPAQSFSAPPAQSFSAPSSATNWKTTGSPQSFAPPATPADQAATVPQTNPFAAAPVAPVAPAAQAAAAQSLGSFSAPAAAAAAQAPIQSLGALNAAPSAGQTAAAQSLFGDAAAAKAAPAQALGAAAAPAQGLSSTPPASTFSAPVQTPAAAAFTPSAPVLPPPPPSGQSLDSFIDSLAHPQAAAPATAPAPAAQAQPLTAAPAAQTAPTSPAAAGALAPSLPAQAAPAAPAAPQFTPPRAVQSQTAPRSAPGDNF